MKSIFDYSINENRKGEYRRELNVSFSFRRRLHLRESSA
uniref:Uncharacterized protein n=1 Tax=Parascaris univalens TaxID=6257 RepID=A0A915B3S2_PARUN